MIIDKKEYQEFLNLKKEKEELKKELASTKEILAKTEKMCEDLEERCKSVIDIVIDERTEHRTYYGRGAHDTYKETKVKEHIYLKSEDLSPKVLGRLQSQIVEKLFLHKKGYLERELKEFKERAIASIKRTIEESFLSICDPRVYRTPLPFEEYDLNIIEELKDPIFNIINKMINLNKYELAKGVLAEVNSNLPKYTTVNEPMFHTLYAQILSKFIKEK